MRRSEPAEQHGGRSPGAALGVLRAGHRRYLAGDTPAATGPGVEGDPVAAVFACADPQTPAGDLFGGVDLFVVRTAGLGIGSAVLGSLEYAVDQLALPVVVVLGHENCHLPGGGGTARVRTALTVLRRQSRLLDGAVEAGRCLLVGMCWHERQGLLRPVLRAGVPAARRVGDRRPPGRQPVRSH